MSKVKLGRIAVIMLALVTVGVLAATTACTPGEAKQLEGVLKNIDSANGEITITTKDGKTVTLTIATEAPVETDGASSNITSLEPGASVEVEVNKDGRVARRVKARQAEVEGVIVQVAGNNVTVESESGRRVTVLVNDRTRIELEDDLSGTIADLQMGTEVEIKFDPESRVAFKIEVEGEEVEDEKEEAERGKSVTREPAVGWGILEIRVTDPGPADVKSAIVYLKNIQVHRVTDNVSDNTTGWIPVIGAPPSFDLMIVDEVAAVLGSANVTAGRFTQIRMEVEKVLVVTVGGDNFTAEVPSGELKIVRPFNVGGGVKTVLTLDFDGEKSLISTGQGKFLFKPVVKLLINNKE
ncbi:MAG: DUF4382 domain-containing protein [Chloroflexi bacterium]|nr:DUF4382 domain-containing protein [Chloroflexota bacterium]